MATGDTKHHLDRLARGGALNLAGAIVSAVAGFALVALITNTFDKSTAGVLFSATSLFIVAMTLILLGTDVGLGRYVLKYAEEGNPAAVWVCVRTAFVVVTCVSLVVTIGLVVAAPALAELMGLTGHQGSMVITILALALPASAFGSLALAATRAFGNMRPNVVVDKLGRSLAQPALVATCALAGGGILWLTAAWVLPYALVAVAAAVALYRLLRQKLPPSNSVVATDAPTIRREFWSFTWPRSIASVAQIVIQRADIIIVAALISPSAAAVYTAATRFVALGKFGTQALQQVLQPQFTQLLATKQAAVLREVFAISSAWNVALAWPIYLAVGCAPAVYLSLFGQDYIGPGTTTVVVMMLGMLVAIYSGPVDTVLLMSGRSTASLLTSLVALAIDLGLCFLLIPRIGISGAAIAWSVAVVVRAVMSYALVRHSLRLSPVSRASAITAGASVACFGLPMLALTVLGYATIVPFVIVGVVGTGCYVAILWLARRPLHLSAMRALVAGRRKRSNVTAGT
jgi:O-antigen/teichoic acid export membrane protein